MRDLDIIIILNSGVYEQYFADYIRHKRSNATDRLLWFIPIKTERTKKNREKNIYNYNSRINKESFLTEYEKNDRQGMFSFFIINPIAYDTWKNRPEYRLSDNPKLDNNILLIDNFINSGSTLRLVKSELLNLGYMRDSFYSFGRSIDPFKGYELKNPSGKIISEEDFFKKIS